MKKHKGLKLIKRYSFVLGVLILSKVSFSLGGIETLTNVTAASVANPVQQTVVSPEAAFYNPSTTAFLEDGSYIYYGGYIALTDYKTKGSILGKTEEVNTDSPQPLPSFSYVYKKGKRSYYMGIGSLGQGGLLTYNADDINMLDDLNVNLIYPGGVFGGSYQISDKTSISLGGRFIYARTHVDAKSSNGNEFESVQDAWGITPQIGIYSRLTDRLSFGATYVARMKLDYDGDVKEGERLGEAVFRKYYIDQRRDFPAMFSTGTTYKLNNHQSISLGWNWIRESQKEASEYGSYGDTYEYSVSFKQYINPKLDLNLGYTYTDKSPNDDEITTITELDAQIFGVSIDYKKNKDTTISIGTGLVMYDDATSNTSVINQDAEVTSKRQEIVFGISINSKL